MNHKEAAREAISLAESALKALHNKDYYVREVEAAKKFLRSQGYIDDIKCAGLYFVALAKARQFPSRANYSELVVAAALASTAYIRSKMFVHSEIAANMAQHVSTVLNGGAAQ